MRLLRRRTTLTGDERRSIEKLTRERRDEPGLGWSRLRDFLEARDIDLAHAELAVLYPDDAHELTAVVVVSIDRMFEVEIEYPRDVRGSVAMDHGQIVSWEEDAAEIRRQNQPFVDVALDLLASE
jgi:hypothetical protein